MRKFVEIWEDGSDNYAVDPPNATLSIFDNCGDIDVVIEITGTPDIARESVVFPAKVLLGDLPDMISVSSLFIDSQTQVKTPGVY